MLHILVDIGLDNCYICLIGHGHCNEVVLEEKHAYQYMVFSLGTGMIGLY